MVCGKLPEVIWLGINHNDRLTIKVGGGSLLVPDKKSTKRLKIYYIIKTNLRFDLNNRKFNKRQRPSLKLEKRGKNSVFIHTERPVPLTSPSQYYDFILNQFYFSTLILWFLYTVYKHYFNFSFIFIYVLGFTVLLL